MRSRRNLVVVRAGETSLHGNWLGADRTWDLVVSWYGDAPYEPIEDETVVAIKGGVGDGLYKTFEALPELIDRYDYFWLPDDDIDADCQSINRLFEITARQGLELSQPALSQDSYFSHAHTFVSPSFLLRYSTLVEVMVPCLSQRKLRAVLPMFRDNPSLFGVDMIWARLDEDNRYKAAIIDAVTVRHTRLPGADLLPKLRGGEHDPQRTLLRVVAEYGLSGYEDCFNCYAGLARGSGRARGPLATRIHMAIDYMRGSRHWRQRGTRRAMRRLFAARAAQLSQLKRIAGTGEEP